MAEITPDKINRWIRVEDSLPAVGDIVLFVTVVKDGIEMGWRPHDGKCWQSVETAPQDEPITFDNEQVTHWHRLPDPPKRKNKMSRLCLVKKREHVKCCPRSKIYSSLADGVLVGTCSKCGKYVVRLNPRTGKQEWLHGESPWTTEDAQ